MKIAVCGLWHLGTVTAACVAEHFETVAWDPDFTGKLPVDEPGLPELWKRGLDSGRLRVGKPDGDIVWLAFDTPVDDDDRADPDFVAKRFAEIDPAPGTLVLVSSQVPVGFTAGLEKKYPKLRFAVSPENLRLGAALDAFRKPARIVVGIRSEKDKPLLEKLLLPFCRNFEWMSIESAEMSKHAINAFLATSIAFANEIATACEASGADAKQVERALRTEPRIGPKAYVSPGAGFSGGTLARDVQALGTPLMKAVLKSNEKHRAWAVEKAKGYKTIAVLGLTYKPGTDTLRRSLAIEICKSLKGRMLRVFDPLVKVAPIDATFCASAEDAVKGADALIVATPWPQFKGLTTFPPVVIDADRLLDGLVPATSKYFAVGKP